MIKSYKIFMAAGSMALLAATAAPASAASLYGRLGLGVNASTTKISVAFNTTAQTNAEAQIDARVTALNSLETRINQMQKVSDSEKASLDATIQAAISNMMTLKAKIAADTDNTTLKTDIQSITKSYRIYVLVIPQGRIMAAADRVMDMVTLFNNLSAQLQARITAAQTAGQNVASLNANLTDMNAKTADANTQAQAAVSEIANLQPDNGDKTVFASNQAALKDARAKIRAATADLVAARKDAGSIVKALVSMKASSSTSVNASSTNQ